MVPLRRQLGAENLERLDGRRDGEQGRGLRHQRLRDRPVQVTLARGFVAEGVEDGERRRSEPQREPQQRGRLLIGEGDSLAQEIGDLFLFAGLGFESGEQCELRETPLRSEDSDMEPSSGLRD